MAFSVALSQDDNTIHTYGDNDIYLFPRSGHLVVEPENKTEIITYSSWVYLRADRDHQAGTVKGEDTGPGVWAL